MLCIFGNPLLAPALDAGEVGFGEIDGHLGRLSIDIGEVAVRGSWCWWRSGQGCGPGCGVAARTRSCLRDG